MKKLLLLLTLLPIFFSCSETDEPIEMDTVFSVSPSRLIFPQEGDVLTFEVTAKNVDFDIAPNGSWMDWDEIGKKSGDNEAIVHTIEVTIGAGPLDGREGKIIVSAQNHKDLEVAIIQEK